MPPPHLLLDVLCPRVTGRADCVRMRTRGAAQSLESRSGWRRWAPHNPVGQRSNTACPQLYPSPPHPISWTEKVPRRAFGTEKRGVQCPPEPLSGFCRWRCRFAWDFCAPRRPTWAKKAELSPTSTQRVVLLYLSLLPARSHVCPGSEIRLGSLLQTSG